MTPALGCCMQSNVVDTSDDVIKYRSVLGSWRVIDYPDHNAGKVARHSLRGNGEPHSLQILAVQLPPVVERDAIPDVAEDSTARRRRTICGQESNIYGAIGKKEERKTEEEME